MANAVLDALAATARALQQPCGSAAQHCVSEPPPSFWPVVELLAGVLDALAPCGDSSACEPAPTAWLAPWTLSATSAVGAVALRSAAVLSASNGCLMWLARCASTCAG